MIEGTDVRTLALQVLLPGFAGTTLPDDYRALLEQGLAGVCYFGSNTADGPQALAALSAAIVRANPHAVIAIDEEGGDVSRLHTLEPSPVLGAAALGAVDDVALTEDVGRWVGSELAAVGVTLDLAPDADVNSDPDNPVIGTRSFGTDAAARRGPHRRVDARAAVDRCRGVREALPGPRRHRHRQPPRAPHGSRWTPRRWPRASSSRSRLPSRPGWRR